MGWDGVGGKEAKFGREGTAVVVRLLFLLLFEKMHSDERWWWWWWWGVNNEIVLGYRRMEEGEGRRTETYLRMGQHIRIRFP
jgi:hypothetical protein